MLTKGKIDERRRPRPKETLNEFLKKTLPTAGYTPEWNTTMYWKFE